MMDIKKIREELKVSDRLIVALDYKPDLILAQGRKWVLGEVRKSLRSLAKTGVTVKLNSALRALGYDIIDEAHQLDLKFFADLKLADIPETLSIDGILLSEAKPEFVTVYCATGVPSMSALKAILPNTEVLGVTVLTNMDDRESVLTLGNTVECSISRLATQGFASMIDGFVCSSNEGNLVRFCCLGRDVTINTPAIRPSWSIVEGDDQNPDRVMTPLKAIRRGADRIIIGRPITKAPNPYTAVMRTLAEIDFALNGH